MRPRKTDPSEEDVQRARDFAAWQKAARDRMGWNIPKLAIETGYSDTQVRLYDGDGSAGIDHTGRYRQPKREYVEAIGRATKLHESSVIEGLHLAGILIAPPRPPETFAPGDMKPVTLSTGEVFYLRPNEPDPDGVIAALEVWLNGYRAGQERRN